MLRYVLLFWRVWKRRGQPLGSQWQGYRARYLGDQLPRLFAQHYETVDGIPAPRWVADNIEWNGTSTCDLFMEV